MGLADHLSDDNIKPKRSHSPESWRQWEPDHEPSTDGESDATTADKTRPSSSLSTLDGLRQHSPAASGVPQALAPLNHHNQLTRFIAKQTLGYIPKLLVRSPERTPTSPSNASYGSLPRDLAGFTFESSPRGKTGSESPSFRLPSLTPPRSPSTFSTQDDHLQTATTTTTTITDGGRSSLPALRPSGASLLLHRSDSFSETCLSPIPPLKRQHTQETTTHHSAMSIADLCQPFRYMRASSCPSDTHPNVPPTPTTTSFNSPLTPPTQHLPSPLSVEPSWRPAIEPQVSSARPRSCTNGIDTLRGSLPPSGPTSPDDGFQRIRLERSSSMDAPTLVRHLKRTAAESIDLTQWLDRPRLSSLSSLADSADSMHQLEQAGRSMCISDSPRSDATAAYEVKREKKLCAFPQCASNAVTRGLCISHGGGRRCQRKDCTRGAQSKGLCVAHGGGRICRAAGCSNIQRSMGLCIRHGGGRRCSVKGCQKGVVRQDLCTAHGGKRKCRVADCTKHVKKKGLCRSHANSLYASSGSS
uniref:WRKY19-like zinc finger domain-containing protein n=1 Tax=Hyaloperonospora arabidopsidis (strain Emoy2) TaxID=559515 RepID=M4B250_HYAAE